MPERVQLSRKRGAKLPPNTVVVSRPSKWGNPFKVGERFKETMTIVKDRRHAWQLYRSLAPQNTQLVERAQRELRGKNLACWCPLPTEPYADDECHAAVLLELANPPSLSGGRDE